MRTIGLFDSVNAPQFQVQFAWGGSATVDPQSGFFTLGTSQLDTGTLGSTSWTTIPNADVLQLQWRRGHSSEVDNVQPGSASIVLDNTSGNYDPLNLQSPYVVPLSTYFHLDSTQLDTGVLALSADVSSPINLGVPVRIIAQLTDPTSGNLVNYPQFRGVVNAITPDYGWAPNTVTFTCLDGLDLLGRRKLLATSAANAGDKTGTRLGRILDLVNWPTSLRSLDTGLSACQGYVGGDFALTLAQQMVDTELGWMFVNGTGVLTFFDRLHAYTQPRSTTVQATFTDDGNTIDYTSIVFDMSADTLYNDAQLTRNGGTVQEVTDVTSAAQYGTRTYPNAAGSQLQTDADALSLAAWLVGRYKNSLMRVKQIQVEALPQGQWITLLGLEIGDRVRAIRNYGVNAAGNYGNTIDRQVLIQGMSVSVAANTWTIQLDTRMVDNFHPFILDTSLLNTGTPA